MVSDVAAIIDGIYRDMQTSIGIPSDSIYLFNMMMDVLGKYGDMEKARYYFEEMKRNGITLNAVSFSTIINVHLQQQVDGSQEYLDQMRDMGIKIDEVLYTTIITVWAKSGDIKQALQLMDFFFFYFFPHNCPQRIPTFSDDFHNVRLCRCDEKSRDSLTVFRRNEG